MELKDLFRQLLKSPETTPFSRIKYLARVLPEEQVQEFISGLYLTAVECKEKEDYTALRDFLEEWEGRTMAVFGRRLALPELAGIPWATVQKPLSQMKLALVTTGGVFVDGDRPFEPSDDWSYRELPGHARQVHYRIVHGGYDYADALKDIDCVYPIDVFRELESEGRIGKLADTHYAFMGKISDPTSLARETAPEVARRLKADGVEACFLAST